MPADATKNRPKYKKIEVKLPKETLALYAGKKVRDAIQEVTTGMNLYKGVRLGQVMEAVYEQGLKDGRREIIEQFEGKIKDKVNYLPPGRPKK